MREVTEERFYQRLTVIRVMPMEIFPAFNPSQNQIEFER